MIKLDRAICIFDLESTGIKVEEDRIVDICILRREPDGSESVFSSLVNPGVPIPPEVSAIHHITDDMVQDQPRLSDLAPKILEMFKDADLSGFNAAKFDIPLLSAEFKRFGAEWPEAGKRVVDSYKIFLLKEKRDLTAAYKFYCGKDLTGAHRAEADVRATAEILWAQSERYADLPKDVAGIEEWTNKIPPGRVDADGKFIWKNGEAVFNFAKHNGKSLRDVVRSDRSYLTWMVDKANFSPDVTRICREALEGKFPVKKD